MRERHTPHPRIATGDAASANHASRQFYSPRGDSCFVTAIRVAFSFLLLCLAATACVRLRPHSEEDYVGPVIPPAVPSETTAPTTEPAKAAAVPTTGTLQLTVPEAILLALENNHGMRIQRFGPPLSRLNEAIARAAFDPVVTAGASYSRTRTRSEDPVSGDTVRTTTERTQGNIGISTFLPTGTDVSIGLSTSRSDTDPGPANNTSRGQLSVTQSLLRGFGLDVNLASLRQARLDTQRSQYELRGYAESLIAQVEETYWDYALAQEQIRIVTDSLNLALDQLRETQERVQVGKLAPTELAAAEAEVASRRESLINARSTLATTRLRLLRLINPASPNLWDRPIELLDRPEPIEAELDAVEEHVKVALLMRPDLNQARLAIQGSDLTLVQTRNGLLPRLDLFITLGGTGYADSFSGSVRGEDSRSYEGTVGFNFDYPIGNRAPQARHQRALISRDQLEEALQNTRQLVEVDVRSAYIEVTRAKEQVAATSATRRAQEEKLRSETEKFRVGKSTSLQVAQAQRDLLSAQIDEVRSRAAYLKALVELYRLEGSLLERRGIQAPGRQPVADLPPRRTGW
ncbi:MAG: TolC family protein [Candidatus Sumerlaeia bacterium]|nr:TolC family protein [Candidatus Sumerlaeia bacterium]